MDFDLDQRTACLSVGEFSAFVTGPRDAGGGGPQGVWRAQLGTHWHNELRARASADVPATEFEIPITGRIVHHGWTLTLTGRIDQLLRPGPPSPRPSAPAPAPGNFHVLRETLPALILREIKTVTRPLPADEAELRAAYPDYFAQLSTYAALARLGALSGSFNFQPSTFNSSALRAELVFVETSSGLAQTLTLTPADETFFRVQLERVAEFLDLRHRARERLRHLSFRPAFATPRAGQETTQADLTATFEKNPLVFFEAPTGFGKTGVLLEFALGQLRAGHFERALYLTSKSTGQLQVVRTLSGMTAPPSGDAVESSKLKVESPDPLPPSDPSTFNLQPSTRGGGTAVAAWHVRNKSEHCVNAVFHCVRESCAYLDALETRWPQSGLARFYLDEKHARDLDTLRAAGRAARICPYEITRAALAFNDVWIGDYNYVFAPANRTLFFNQPGFNPARTLLLLDEAHNLPSRVADAHSHLARAADARSLLAELDHLDAPRALQRAWESWTLLLSALRPVDALDPALEADVADTLARIADQLSTIPLDYAALGPQLSDQLWKTQTLSEWLSNSALKKLLWCPAAGDLSFTCIDAADAIGATLREFGGVVAATATFGPAQEYAEAIGLGGRCQMGDGRWDRTEIPSESPPALLHRVSAPTASAPISHLPSPISQFPSPISQFQHLTATTPWRDRAYDVAVDARVDTKFQHRSRHYATTAATVAALHASAASSTSHLSPLPPHLGASRAVAVFFPSYAYAETIARHFDGSPYPSSQLSALSSQLLPPLRIALQPRVRDLAAQAAWVEESLAFSDALFLVLGSSFAESIDLLGGRVTHAMVVGPALPEVNAIQRARLAEFAPLGREAAFRRVYQIPGMTKVNQALGRLVRAPGQRARVLLHCQRFLEPSYASLLARDYQFGKNILTDADLATWLAQPPKS